jgi:hypothetical protein
MVAEAKADVMRSAAEVAVRLDNAIRALSELTLLNASKAKVEMFFQPELCENRQRLAALACGWRRWPALGGFRFTRARLGRFSGYSLTRRHCNS